MMTRRLHTAFSTSAVKYACVTIQGPPRGAPETGGVTRIRRGNRPPRDAPRAPRRHRGPVRPVSAVCARFPRVRASNASWGAARPGRSRARRLAGARRGRAAGVRCRSRRGEPVRSREAVCRHRGPGQWSGGDGVPLPEAGSFGGVGAVESRVARRPRGGRFASRSVFFRPARAHRRSGAQRRTPRSRPIAIAPDAVQCAYKSIHGAPLQYLRRRPRGPLASCRPSCMPSRLSSSMARSDLILLDFG